ncbi:hypothetical protein [Phytohabitans houttuyneae]|uniref:hypothetical protein n=1 Tax=Phytohabitans houttuyneae TaxID=1076126 RepID=UPI001C49C26C|nr:hypothetical protein [Phytohabitans houttuyneae]
MLPRVPLDLVEHGAGFAALQPPGELVDRSRRAAGQLGGRARPATLVRHRAQLAADRTQPAGRPALLAADLAADLVAGHAVQLAGAFARLPGDLPALLGGRPQHLPAALGGRVPDVSGLFLRHPCGRLLVARG